MTSKTILKLNILFSPFHLPINQIISITQSFAGIPNKARLNYLAVDLNDNVLIRMNIYGYCKFTVNGYNRMYFPNDQNILFAGGYWTPVNIFSLSLLQDFNFKKLKWWYFNLLECCGILNVSNSFGFFKNWINFFKILFYIIIFINLYTVIQC